MKTKTILAVILLTMMLIPVVSACPEPEPRPQFHYKTTWKNPQYRLIWNGKQWIDNPNTYSYWLDGRFWVVFPNPY